MRKEEPLEASGSGPSQGRPRALERDQTRHGGVVTQRWATFALHTRGSAASAPPVDPAGQSEWFDVEAVEVVVGAPAPLFVPGARLNRHHQVRSLASGGEWAALIDPACVGGAAAHLGLLDEAHSSADDEARGLRDAWRDNPFRVSLIMACKHGARFWDRRPEERTFDHLAAPRRGARAAACLDRAIRQLHRVPSPGVGEWDCFVYFEMLPTEVAHLREYLHDHREAGQRASLQRRVDLWLVKRSAAD